jgi:hypothetical protein
MIVKNNKYQKECQNATKNYGPEVKIKVKRIQKDSELTSNRRRPCGKERRRVDRGSTATAWSGFASPTVASSREPLQAGLDARWFKI